MASILTVDSTVCSSQFFSWMATKRVVAGNGNNGSSSSGSPSGTVTKEWMVIRAGSTDAVMNKKVLRSIYFLY